MGEESSMPQKELPQLSHWVGILLDRALRKIPYADTDNLIISNVYCAHQALCQEPRKVLLGDWGGRIKKEHLI